MSRWAALFEGAKGIRSQASGFKFMVSGFRLLDLPSSAPLPSEPPPSVWKVDIRLPGKGSSIFHGARPAYYNHLDDQVDSDQ